LSKGRLWPDRAVEKKPADGKQMQAKGWREKTLGGNPLLESTQRDRFERGGGD